MADIIRTLYAQAEESGGGLVAWIELRAYPAVLLLTSYGIGLTRARRWQALREILASEVQSRYRNDPERIVDRLFLWSWDGAKDQYWQKLEGLERRKTPLSEHLHQIFTEWASSFQGVVPNFDELFETWEVLASFCHLEQCSIADLQVALNNGDPANFVWMPVGRSGWHTQTRERILRTIQAEPMLTELRTAGLAKGSAEFLPLAVQNLQRIARKMEW